MIGEALLSCDVVVALLSEHANSSPHVLDEIALAAQEGRLIIPVRLDESKMDPGMRLVLSRLNWVDALEEPRQSTLSEVAHFIAGLTAVG